MIGLPLGHFWFGHGSAIFLEFGRLSPGKRRDGSEGDPQGEYGVMIEWGWRLEGRKYILCGCRSDEDRWEPSFDMLRDTSLASVSLTGRLSEIDLCFSNEMHCVSFMIEKGHPQWTIFDRRSDKLRTLISRKGRVELERPARPYVSPQRTGSTSNDSSSS
ncbi:MAG: hypothetical protein GY789_29755 [Hyphomicrobiales bacterium]|nr:hypothetical protein [Hyphomicrobiales bacterium]MCP4997995.1 hypothetical protein [Hyphomicrobiales bacterium]